jgi:hypothetical protein
MRHGSILISINIDQGIRVVKLMYSSVSLWRRRRLPSGERLSRSGIRPATHDLINARKRDAGRIDARMDEWLIRVTETCSGWNPCNGLL